jgi:hypothetical protein
VCRASLLCTSLVQSGSSDMREGLTERVALEAQENFPRLNHNRSAAGRLLVMQIAKKLGQINNDNVAGDAMHRELVAVVGRQEACKLKDRNAS